MTSIQPNPAFQPEFKAQQSDFTTKRYGFLVISDFALLSYSSAVEPLRAANHLSGQHLYDWQHFSIDGLPAIASNGLEIPCEVLSEQAASLDALLSLIHI